MKLDKPIRLISLFSGYDSQLLALKYLGLNVESWRTCEWAVKSIQALKDLHFENDNADYSKDLTKEQLIDFLTKKGISADYNKPMTEKQVKRLGETKLRTIYNNIKATHNMVNIQQTNGVDLGIEELDKYNYIMTYSFPCQDLSLAGKQKGMAEGSGTRSSMLWEVGRILEECDRGRYLPQILLMENVPQVHNKKNIEYFNLWLDKLKSLGYKNHWCDLNAKNYGIPQNRNRCFVVSLLDNCSYKFPESVELKLELKDLLEETVDKKYYLSDKMVKYISSTNNKWTGNNGNASCINRKISCTKTTREGNIRADTSDFVSTEFPNNYNVKDIKLNCLGLLNIKGNEQIRRVYDENGLSPTINTCNGGNRQPKILLSPLQKEVCDKALDFVEPTDIIDYTYSNARLKEMDNGDVKTKNKDNNNISCTLTTNSQNFGVCVRENSVANNVPRTNLKNINETLEKNIDKIQENAFIDGYNRNIKTDGLSGTITTRINASNNIAIIGNMYRIRKLTPKECFRLMGVCDKDFDKIAKNQSDSSLYHLAGDSIVTTCLGAIFGSLFDIDWVEKFNKLGIVK